MFSAHRARSDKIITCKHSLVRWFFHETLHEYNLNTSADRSQSASTRKAREMGSQQIKYPTTEQPLTAEPKKKQAWGEA